MKVTSIKRQLKRADRLSVFIDGKYTLSLSEAGLLKSRLVPGQELSVEELDRLKKLAAQDGLYDRAVRYAALRLRSKWEMSNYLQRKGASPTLMTSILNKLSDLDLVSDEKFARAFIADRQRLRPTSRRKIIYELQTKHVPESVIAVVLPEENSDDAALRALIKRKRQLSRFQDDLKLMQYLSRQGFGYGDIKAAMQDEEE